MFINKLDLNKLSDAKLYLMSMVIGLFTGIFTVPYHYIIQNSLYLRQFLFSNDIKWYFHVLIFFCMWAILLGIAWMTKKLPLIAGGGISQTRGVLLGRIHYKRSFLELLAKFTGGSLGIATGLSLGREGPSIQMGSYIGDIVSKYTGIRKGERNHLIAAGAGAGLAAAFSAPLSAAILVIESLERFDAPKTSITTLLAGIIAGVMSNLIFKINVFNQISAITPMLSAHQNVLIYLGYALFVSFFGKLYYEFSLYTKNKYPNIKLPVPLKILLATILTYTFCLFVVDLTGGGQSFLIHQATGGSINIWFIILMMFLHFTFTAISYSLGLPGGSFVPMLVTGGLLGKIYALFLIEIGIIGHENIGYFMLIGMSVFLIAVIRTPITAIILITEITGHYEVFFATVIIGAITYYITQILQIKPLNLMLYQEMINAPEYKQQKKTTLNLSIMPGSFFDQKKVEELRLPNHCQLINIFRKDQFIENIQTVILQEGDQMEIEIDTEDIEKLYEPLTGMATVY